jgi:hypothetical protein
MESSPDVSISVYFLIIIVIIVISFKLLKTAPTAKDSGKNKVIFASLNNITFQNSWRIVYPIVLFIIFQAIIGALTSESGQSFVKPTWEGYFPYILWILLVPICVGVFSLLKPSLAELSNSEKPTSPFAAVFTISGIIISVYVAMIFLNEWGSIPANLSVEGPTMLDDYSTVIPFGPDGPYFWLGYNILSLFMVFGMIYFLNRVVARFLDQSKLKNLEFSTIRKIALDPEGVIEGRIELPRQSEPCPPSEWETDSSKMILVLSTTLTIIGLMAIIIEMLDGLQSRRFFFGGGELAISAYLLCFITYSYLCSLASIKLLNTTIDSESESLLDSVRPRESSQQESPEQLQTPDDEAARLDDVIRVLEHQMAMVRLESETLSNELKETKVKVTEMETELEEKSEEMDDLKVVLGNMQTIADDSKEGDNKSLMMSDSVLVGDALFGSTKINSQIINDPAAIARAAIEAYREGRKDGGL